MNHNLQRIVAMARGIANNVRDEHIRAGDFEKAVRIANNFADAENRLELMSKPTPPQPPGPSSP